MVPNRPYGRSIRRYNTLSLSAALGYTLAHLRPNCYLIIRPAAILRFIRIAESIIARRASVAIRSFLIPAGACAHVNTC